MAHIQKRTRRDRRGRPYTLWVARYRDPSGRERSRAFRRQTDAERFAVGEESKKIRGEWLDPALGRTTLDDYFRLWMKRARETGKPTERTLIAYRGTWDRYIGPRLGARTLGSLTRADCQAVVDGASSPWQASDARKVLSSVLGSAVREELIARNPTAGLSVPHIEQREPPVLSMAKVEELATVIDPRYRALVLLGSFGALRWSELVGLRASDVDFLRRRVRIERKIVESGKLIVGEPKTKRSRRWVSIPESVALALAEHVRLFSSAGFLFPGPEGGALRRRTFRRAWTPATLTAGVQGFPVRALRHSGATWALEAGISPVLVAFRLGHSSTRMIEAHYGRLIESMDAEIAGRLGDARASLAGQMRDRDGMRASGGSLGDGENGL